MQKITAVNEYTIIKHKNNIIKKALKRVIYVNILIKKNIQNDGVVIKKQ